MPPQRKTNAKTGREAKASKSKTSSRKSATKKAQADKPDEAKKAVRVFRGLTLNDFQVSAVEAIERGNSVLVSAPTGAGKTLVAEYAIEETLEKGRRAIYTAPVKALSNQKYRDFKKELGKDVGIMTGDVTINPQAPLLIMTTEICRNTIFERPEDLSDVEYIVFDEIHYMDDPERGTVWEESIIFAPPHIRLVCLSATVSNLSQFGEWIGEVRHQTVEVVRSKDRPVPLHHYFYLPAHGLKRADKAKFFPREKRRRRGPQRGGEQLLDYLQREDKLPVLFFCFSRKECEIRASHASKRNLLSPEEREEIQQLFDEICELFEIERDEELDTLRPLILQGIAFHHAGVLPVHKELVERLFTSGRLKLLFTTETFALGINMPARSVVFASLRKFDGIGFDVMMAREYQQMAGRAGRQGIDDEGLVYSIIDDDRLNARDASRVVFGHIEPIRSRFKLSYSTLINLHRRLGDRVFEAWEHSFNNYQWARMNRKKREKNERRQIETIRRRLAFLKELAYVDDDGVLEKGEVASLINGFEIQATELLFAEVFHHLNEDQINVVCSSLVFEERRKDLFTSMDRAVLGRHRSEVEDILARISTIESDLGIHPPIRPPNFKLGAVMVHWSQGHPFEELATLTNASQGDLVRAIRLTIQLIRQLRKAIPEQKELRAKLSRCIDKINRGVVDAKRQLEMG